MRGHASNLCVCCGHTTRARASRERARVCVCPRANPPKYKGLGPALTPAPDCGTHLRTHTSVYRRHRHVLAPRPAISAAAGKSFAEMFMTHFAAGFKENNHAVTLKGLLADKLSWDWSDDTKGSGTPEEITGIFAKSPAARSHSAGGRHSSPNSYAAVPFHELPQLRSRADALGPRRRPLAVVWFAEERPPPLPLVPARTC